MTEKEKKIEKDRRRIRKSIERLESLFSELDRGVLVEDRERKIIYANQSFCDLFGIPSPEVLTGMDCSQAAIASADLFSEPSEFLEDLDNILEKGKTVKSQKLYLKDGRIFSRDFIVGEMESKIIGNIWLYKDVTLEKQKEEEISKSNQQWELFFSQSISGIFFMMLDEPVRWDDNTDKEKVLEHVFAHQKISRVNKAMLNQFRLQESELLGTTPAWLYRHNIEEGKEVWKKLFNEGRVHINTRKLRNDGSFIDIEGDYSCIYDEKGRITGHFGIQKDITERYEYQQLLKKSKEKYKSFYLNAPVAYQSLNSKGDIIDVNKKWSEETGYTRKEAISKNFFDLLDERSYKTALEYLNILINMGSAGQVELNLKRKDDSYITILIQGNATHDEEGNFIHTNCIFNNITEKRKTEKALLENQQQLQAIFDNALTGIGFTKTDGTIIKVNNAFTELTGYSEKELYGKSFSDFAHPEDREMEMTIISDMLSGKKRFAQ
ncbi:MAG: PAS domain S-box protein, partial [Bacteroidota bacterium]